MRNTSVKKVYTAEMSSGKLRPTDGKISNAQLLAAISQLQALVIASAEAETKADPAPAKPIVPAPEPEVVAQSEPEPSSFDEDIIAIRQQIGEMARTIDRTKLEIAAIKHPLAENDAVLNASSQLDAIVDATEVATQNILDATEQVEETIKRMVALFPDNAELIGLSEEAGGHLIRVMEACGFQDLTGQRVTKVVGTLRFIEERVGAVISIWGEEAFHDIPVETNSPDPEGDEVLMNGPQLEGQGISQADIDALFD